MTWKYSRPSCVLVCVYTVVCSAYLVQIIIITCGTVNANTDYLRKDFRPIRFATDYHSKKAQLDGQLCDKDLPGKSLTFFYSVETQLKSCRLNNNIQKCKPTAHIYRKYWYESLFIKNSSSWYNPFQVRIIIRGNGVSCLQMYRDTVFKSHVEVGPSLLCVEKKNTKSNDPSLLWL